MTGYYVSAFLKTTEAKGRKKRTIDWYRGILRIFTVQYQKLPLTPGACEDFILSCKAGDERRHGYYRALNAMYNYAERRMGLKNNPMRQVDPPSRKKKLPRPLTPEQLNQLLMFPHPARIIGAMLFISDTGCRLSEVLSLNHNSFYETEYGIVASIDGKTGERLVPISRTTYKAILKVIPFKIGPNRLSKIISQAFKDARVPGSAINLRHTFGTLWEGSEEALQAIMGHTDFKMTQKYRALRTKLICEQHAIYSPLRRVLPSSQRML